MLSALPRQEPFQAASRDSSEREETSGIRSQYVRDEVPVERWDARALTLARVEVMTSMRPRRRRPQCGSHILRSGVQRAREQTKVTRQSCQIQ